MSTIQPQTNEVNQSPTKRRDLKKLQRHNRRMERRASHSEEANQRRRRREAKKEARQPVRRIFPIWLRIIVVLVLSYLALLGGLMVGFGVLGNGSPTDALEFDTWRHIIELVTYPS
ncbi:DNA-directed RNA polymerase subunit beta [Aquibacillus albus]|uniref:DNA-directed RNA polymerase subunit beta n=1 Tax=Aquibacillus albus TaxID=1168171 RepID=A0ABS2MZP3_9BACI|nr:DNA-directed RNA polymerase subunit beta [Aquibacillus albus]MBM7571306.1 hypothetical protein [Aquibacillus albus]